MKLEEFVEEAAVKVIDLWKDHVGFFYNSPPTPPALLSTSVRDQSQWISNFYEERWGSQWSEDAKFFLYIQDDGSLEIECQMQEQTIDREDREAAKKGQDNFNREINDYLNRE